MSRHVFHEIYLHINWHTQDDLPLLNERIEPLAHRFIEQRCGQTDGVRFLGIGGTDTHVHLAAQVEPHLNVSDLVGDLKGSSAHEINKETRRKAVVWQRGFGVVSFGKNNVAWVLRYIANQRQHHAKGTARSRLETTLGDSGGEAG